MTFTRLNSTHTHTHSLVRFLLSIAWLTKLPELPHLRSLHTARAHTHTESTSESFIRFLYTLPCGRSSASSMLSAVLSRWFVCFMTSLFYSSHARGATVKLYPRDTLGNTLMREHIRCQYIFKLFPVWIYLIFG